MRLIATAILLSATAGFRTPTRWMIAEPRPDGALSAFFWRIGHRTPPDPFERLVAQAACLAS